MRIRSAEHGELFAGDMERAVKRPRSFHGGGGGTARSLDAAAGRPRAAGPAGRG
ncbi:hypothetical protein Acsp04_36900 [Actinomadura sp. NBRC 104425]|nr:hypothetical protein Acsp04_36900 [Actinomadura sp. NBRC 104425]